MNKYLVVFISLFLFLSINAQEKYLHTASNGFQWYSIEYDNGIEGAQDKSGKDIISSTRGYSDIVLHVAEDKFGYFTVKYGNLMGVCDMKGAEIVPCKYSNIIYHPYDRVLMYENYDGKYISLNISLENNANANFNLPSANESLITSNPTLYSPSHNNGTSQVSNKEYGTHSKHGNIINRTSEKRGTATITQEWYEDGYSSILIIDKCRACGGTGKVGYNLCTAGCAMGTTTLLTYYDKNGNEMESTGTMANYNNIYSSGGNGVSNSGGSSSSSSHSSSSVYTKCTSCNGTGICPRCGGKKGSWQNTGYYTGSGSESWINCGGCNGSGKCSICYGRGKL